MANNKNNASEKNYFDIPVWRRYTLTIEEAAGYYHIGEGKLRIPILCAGSKRATTSLNTSGTA